MFPRRVGGMDFQTVYFFLRRKAKIAFLAAMMYAALC